MHVDQSQLDLQLKVWKELALSKQMLMRTAAEALDLDPNCDQDQLKAALDRAIQRAKDAEASVVTAKQQAQQSINEIDKKLTAALRAQTIAEATAADIVAKQERVAPQMAAERAAVAKEIAQLKAQVAEKDKALKAINTALADTPDNVVKKLKTLKKEKQDEADLRKQIEATFSTLRKEKQEQDKEFSELKDNSTKLVAKYRELHEQATKVHEQLKPFIKEGEELLALQMLDDKFLELIVPADKADKDDKKDTKAKKK
jgi:DNA repair exonuclease SbcCD ATPase subunit